jgi:hypothetical protein
MIQATNLLLNKILPLPTNVRVLSIKESNLPILSSVILGLPHSMSQTSPIKVRFSSGSHMHFSSAIKNPNSDKLFLM